jgi:hypothetical protein
MTSAELSLEYKLLQEFGPFAPVSGIWRQLSYPNPESARKAALRGTLPVPSTVLPHRRGRFVRTTELAAWLNEMLQSEEPS